MRTLVIPRKTATPAAASATTHKGQGLGRLSSSRFILVLGSPLREKLRNFLGRNGAFAHDAPARFFVSEIDDRRGHLSGRCAAVDNDGDAVQKLIAYRQRRSTFQFSTQVGGSRGNRNLRRLDDRERNGSFGDT